MIEQEVKLSFPHVEAARQAIVEAGGRLVVSRRLVDDRLFDLPDGRLRRRGMTLRTRRDAADAYLTVKGPVLAGPVKSREELETRVDDVDVLEAALSAIGFVRTFRAQKYREEYALPSARLTIDQVPFGVFVEIEGTPDVIARVAGSLGRTPSDYRLESYPTLWRQWCAAAGRPEDDMLFDDSRNA
ncbi:MAG: class IV adenylate cyclase [Acidobacteria bacterium]|nr:class IV adenylate cyclase [Acidobacteriota bacterium]